MFHGWRGQRANGEATIPFIRLKWLHFRLANIRVLEIYFPLSLAVGYQHYWICCIAVTVVVLLSAWHRMAVVEGCIVLLFHLAFITLFRHEVVRLAAHSSHLHSISFHYHILPECCLPFTCNQVCRTQTRQHTRVLYQKAMHECYRESNKSTTKRIFTIHSELRLFA